MKASGEGAGTTVGLGVEELRADNTQEVSHKDDFETHLTLPVLNRNLRVQAGERKVQVILVRESERVCF